MKTFDVIEMKEKLKAYIFIYCAKADYIISEEEKAYIHEKVKLNNIEHIYEEINQINDYQIIQRIIKLLKTVRYSKIEKRHLLKDIHYLFIKDSRHCQLKKMQLKGLQYIIT